MKHFKFLGMNLPWFGTEADAKSAPQKNASHRAGRWGSAYHISFDGEKNFGEIGPVVKYQLDHVSLRFRSYDAYLTSEIARTVLDRFSMWVIDKGLKLQLNPSKNVLNQSGIELNVERYNNAVESRFSVWAKSKRTSYNGMHSLNDLAKMTFKGANIGGDMLVILRFKSGKLKVQVIDGAHLGTPVLLHNPKNGNKIIHGVEIDKNGKHVAYHVRVTGNKTERISAWSKTTGLRLAWMVYGTTYRNEDLRGLPVMATSLETLAKIERYKEAAVGSAEERQKIAFAIEHNQFSTGENPMADDLAQLYDSGNDGANGAVPVDDAGNTMASTVAATTNKETFNMPVGSKLTMLESKNEMFFQEFYQTNANIICSALGIPPNVAFSVYNDSFSASRAATKDWEHTMDVLRDSFQQQFYAPILAMWLHMEILDFNIQAPGYIQAFQSKNWLVVEAYQTARFTGPMFPHVDPLKEAKAERVKLGSLGDHLPLTTLERATELLAGGDSTSNIEQFGEELKEGEKAGLTTEEKEPTEPGASNQ